MITKTNSVAKQPENRTIDELKLLFEKALTLNKEMFLALQNEDNNRIEELILLGAPFSLFNLGKTHEEIKHLFNIRDKDSHSAKNFETCFFPFQQWIENNPNYLKLALKHSHFTKRLNKEIWLFFKPEEIKEFISNNNKFLLEDHNIKYIFQDNAKLDLFLSYSQSIKNLTNSIYKNRGLIYLIQFPPPSFQKIFEILTFKKNYHTTLINNLLKTSLYFDINILCNNNIKENIDYLKQKSLKYNNMSYEDIALKISSNYYKKALKEENNDSINFMNSMYADYISVILNHSDLDIKNMKKMFPKVFESYFKLSNNLDKKENIKHSYKI